MHRQHSPNKLVLALVLLVASVAFVCSAYTEQLIFYDDFNIFDTKTWKHEMTLTGGGNWEFQQYVNNRSISFVDNGVLYIKPMATNDYLGTDITKEGFTVDLNGITVPDQCTSAFQWGCSRTTSNGYIVNPMTSARIRTAEHFSFKYGRVEIKAKLPRGDWLWPALWMMPSANRYGPWPASGEIDIIESRGNKDYMAITPEGGVESVASTLHWGPFFGENGYALTRYSYHLKNGKDFADDFHTFGLYWDDKRMYTYVDNENQKIMDLNFTQSFWDKANANGMKWDVRKLFNPWTNAADRAPFNQEFYLILCLAVGTTNGYFPDNVPAGPNRNYPKPWSNSDDKAFANFWKNRNMWLPSWVGNDTALKIDSVKVWGFKEISTWTIDGVALTGASTSISSLILMIIGIIALVLASLALCATVTACAYWLIVPKFSNYVKSWKEGRAQKMRERELSETSTRGMPLADVRAQRNATTHNNIITSTHHLDTSDEMTS